MYNRALRAYINLRTYVHPLWKPLHPLCSWSGYGLALKPLATHWTTQTQIRCSSWARTYDTYVRSISFCCLSKLPKIFLLPGWRI